MYITVKLLQGYSAPLTYKAPNDWPQQLVGSLVRVPLRNYSKIGIIVTQHIKNPLQKSITLKQAEQIEPFPNDPLFLPFIQTIATYYQTDYLLFLKRLYIFLHQKKPRKIIETTIQEQSKQSVLLTNEQQATCNALLPYITNPKYKPTLLHGVTGSGKTEVYKKLIQAAIAHNKSAILLLPEVTLALQFKTILRAQLPNSIVICSFHSGVSTTEKRLLWHRLLHSKPTLIIGVHLPIMLPIANLGLLIVDEEHETGYQEKKHPKVNTKEAALVRAQQYNIPIILGSATPSVQSLYNTKQKGWLFFQLTKRFGGAFPTIKTVSLADKKQRRNFWISQDLENAIKDRIAKKEQTIIFLNRRGFSFFVQCKACSFIFECNQCSVSLTLHASSKLSCHYCGFNKQLPPACPVCTKPEKQFLKKGIGTQKLVTIIERLIPGITVARADMDTTSKKKEWKQTVTNFTKGNIDVLVGTQSIAKGFHFPNVTLVGILWADLNLHFPVYHASETTLQQIIQVAGRAGRQKTDSLVIVQTMAQHNIFNYINEKNYLQFYEQELEKRALVNYPPCTRLVEIELKNKDELTIEQESQAVAYALRSTIAMYNIPVFVLGPAKPPIHKIAKIYTRTLFLKGKSINHLITLFKSINVKSYKSSIFFTPNPH